MADEFADQRHVAFASVFWGSSGTLPVPIVAAVASSSALATFAVADKMYRAGVFGIQALASSFQGWVAEPPPDQRRRRMVIATASHSVLGMLGLLAFAFAGPAVSGFLFGQDLAADRATCALFGVATLALAISSSLGNHWLAPMRMNRALLNSAIAGTLVGLPTRVRAGRRASALRVELPESRPGKSRCASFRSRRSLGRRSGADVLRSRQEPTQ